MKELHLLAAVVTTVLLRAISTTSQQTTTQQANVKNVTLCGEAFLHAFPGETGVVSSPVYPKNYPNSVACFWSIAASDPYVVELTVVRLEMEECRMCSCDSLAIYDGAHINSTLLHKLCKFLDKKIYSTGQALRLEFVSDPIGTESGFQLNFTAVDLRKNLSLSGRAKPLEVNITVPLESEGTLQTPGYPLNYTNNIDLRWRLEAADVNYTINVTFTAIDIETCSDFLCTCDFVEVFDGPSDTFPRLEKLCLQVPSLLVSLQVLSSGPSTYIRFYSDNWTTGRGFSLTYSVHKSAPSPCGTTTLRATPGKMEAILYSPDYMNLRSYSTFQRFYGCLWSVSTNDSYVIELTVVDMYLENEGCYDCACANIEIYDDNLTHTVLLQRLCKIPPEKIYSIGPKILVVFYASDHGAHSSFLLTFTAVHLTPSSSAVSTTPRPTTTSGVVKYFSVKLTVPLGATSTLQTPGFPGNYTNNAEYRWQLEVADPNYVICVSFSAIDMETCSGTQCSCDYVDVFDASSSSYTSSRLAKLCSSVPVPPELFSSGPNMYIRFYSDSFLTGRGFNLTYSAVHRLSAVSRTTTTTTTTLRIYSTVPEEHKCDSSPVFLLASTSETRYIYSPMYPGNYYNNAECSWKIRASDGYVIQMVVQIVDMERCGTSCTCDKVQVFDAFSYAFDRRMLQFCSSLSNNVLYTTQQYAFITFTSDTSVTGKGFVITYKAVTYDTDYFRTTVSSPTFTEEHTTNLVVIVVGCIIAAAAFIAIVVLVAVLISRRRKRILNTYSNLPRVGPSAAVPTLPPPAVYYYPHPGGATVPEEVFPPQTLPSSTAFSNKAYAPDLIPTSNQPKEVADLPPSL